MRHELFASELEARTANDTTDSGCRLSTGRETGKVQRDIEMTLKQN